MDIKINLYILIFNFNTSFNRRGTWKYVVMFTIFGLNFFYRFAVENYEDNTSLHLMYIRNILLGNRIRSTHKTFNYYLYSQTKKKWQKSLLDCLMEKPQRFYNCLVKNNERKTKTSSKHKIIKLFYLINHHFPVYFTNVHFFSLFFLNTSSQTFAIRLSQMF